MKLGVKIMRFSAGKPIAFLSKKDAEVLDLHAGERVLIKHNSSTMIAVADIADDFVRRGQVALSEEILSRLHLSSKSKVEIFLTVTPKSSSVLQGRIHCKPYSKEELVKIINDIVNNALTEAEVAYFISGVNYCGMSLEETRYLTEAIYENGKHLTWKSNKVIDKHSIGGIPANRTTPIVVSICAAAGLIMPKTSSRAITSAAGTADVIETIAKVDLPLSKLKSIVNKTGACLAWGGALGLAPADDKLIQVEKMLNLDPEPQLLASILAKKLAVGSKLVLIDIPYGNGAKVTHAEALRLKKKFIQLGSKLGLKIKVALTKGNEPIGNGIGPALEMRDVIRVLKREDGPKDLERKSVYLAGLILEMAGKSEKGRGKKLAQQILDSKRAYGKFEQIIKAQNGKVISPKVAKFSEPISINKKGTIKSIDNHKINFIARLAGCPIDKGAGLYLHKHVGDKLVDGEAIVTVYSESKIKLKEATSFFKLNCPIILH